MCNFPLGLVENSSTKQTSKVTVAPLTETKIYKSSRPVVPGNHEEDIHPQGSNLLPGGQVSGRPGSGRPALDKCTVPARYDTYALGIRTRDHKRTKNTACSRTYTPKKQTPTSSALVRANVRKQHWGTSSAWNNRKPRRKPNPFPPHRNTQN